MLLTLLLAAQLTAAAANPPCTAAEAKCTQFVTLKNGPARSLVYTTYPLDRPNAAIRAALIMVPGTNRNADHYFRTATTAAFLAGALEDSIVIAPRIASADGSCHDTLELNEVSWSCGGDSWRSGGPSPTSRELTSFDFVDEILRRLGDRKVFPNLRAIVVAGHSAGGQFVARYELANKVHESLGVPVTYVVANPSSYAWPDATRPLPVDDATPENAALGWKTETPHANFSYGAYQPTGNCAASAQTYDKWPFGLTQ